MMRSSPNGTRDWAFTVPVPLQHSFLIAALAFASVFVLAAASQVREVPPSDTDAAITPPYGITNDIRHIVIVPKNRRGKLFLFFPGTGAAPSRYTSLLAAAAECGYHAVGLVYVNDKAINFHYCSCRQHCPGCHEEVRLEILTGRDTSSRLTVGRANSIEGRFLSLLRYLRDRYPAEGWSSFFSGEDIAWGAVAVSGHSQGGGHAAMAAKVSLVDRVILFNSTEPSPWTRNEFATPAERFYGIVHEKEDLFPYITRCWDNLRLPGTLTRVDGAAPPYGNSHRLATAHVVEGHTKIDCHNAIVIDDVMPYVSGVPVYRTAWIYLLGGVLQ